MTITDDSIKAFSGMPSFGWTRAKNREAGRPPSLLTLALLMLFDELDVPCKSENHTTTRRHDTNGREDQTDKG